MPGDIAFRFDGEVLAMAELRREAERMRGTAFADLIGTAEQIRSKAVGYAPKRTGRLAGSSFTEVDTAAGTVAVGFSDFPPKAKAQEKRQSYLNRATREVWNGGRK